MTRAWIPLALLAVATSAGALDLGEALKQLEKPAQESGPGPSRDSATEAPAPNLSSINLKKPSRAEEVALGREITGNLLGTDVRKGQRTDLDGTVPRPEQLPRTTRNRYRKVARVPVEFRKTYYQVVSETDVPSIGGLLKYYSALTKQAEDEAAKRALHVVSDQKDGIYLGDFREKSSVIEDDSVELVFIDPPYDDESIPLYGDAAEVAARILRPGGSLVTYCGQLQLPHVFPLMLEHLHYWWTGYFLHQTPPFARMNQYGVIVHGKPLLWFTKGKRGDRQTFVDDVVANELADKDFHPWQQSEDQASYYIDKLTQPEGLVVDFFVGGGTTAVCAKRLGRKFIGFEINEEHYVNALKRLESV